MRRRGSFASLLAILGALLAAPMAPAATLSVDDDRQDCSAATFTTVQDAIDAAAPGDTIAICPGTYAEGNAQPNTNALKIDKSITLKGAGADLVTISPRRYDGNDGVIAEDPQNIRYPSGNILTAVGTPAVPITVDISGVTFDGNAVAAKAGVVFLDAQGSLRRSRVTDIVTSESPGAYDMPGGYRSSYLGYGVAQVTAALTAPLGAGPRTLTIANTRIDEYNRAGVLIDGGTDAASPVTPSGVDLRAVVSTSQIVGRSLCWDSNVDGDCGVPRPPGNPEPQPIADGPLFGQDGIRLLAGARGAVSGSIVTQNLVPGPGRPGAQQRDEQRAPAQGGRDPADRRRRGQLLRHTLQRRRQRLRHRQRGRGRRGRRGRPDEGREQLVGAVLARRHLRRPDPLQRGAARERRTGEHGPGRLPGEQPGYPENPVNGAPSADGSTTVDFLPFRDGPQSDPNRGQFPVVPAPIPVSDAAPDVTVSPERASYRRGETVKLSAEPSDDFGIRRVTFFDGATEVGGDASPPYTAAFTLPADAACGARSLAATAEDSLGQTASGTATLTVVCDEPPGPQPKPPTVKLPDNLDTIRRSGTTVTVRPESERPIASVDFFLGARQACHDTSAPYQCRIVPRASEIGSQTLRVVATDSGGLTGQDSRQVTVPRFKPRGLRLRATSQRLKGRNVRRTVTATVLPPAGVGRRTACRGGRVAIVVKRARTTLIDREKQLDRRCKAVVMRYTSRRGDRRLRYTASVRFGGTTVLSPVRKTRRFR